jgi:hypothetical protein
MTAVAKILDISWRRRAKEGRKHEDETNGVFDSTRAKKTL